MQVRIRWTYLALVLAANCATGTPAEAQVRKDDARSIRAAEPDMVLPDQVVPEDVWVVYGQLAPSVLSFNDGVQQQSLLADNSNSASRLGLYVDWEGWILGRSRFNFEFGLGLRQSAVISQSNTPDAWDVSQRNLRILEFINQGEFGTVSIGQGSMSTDGIAESDQSGTAIVATSSVADGAGSYFFRTAAGELSSVQLASVFQNLDGFRSLRVRYDAPKFRNLSASVSVGSEILFDQLENDTLEMALTYRKATSSYRIIGAAGFALVREKSGELDGRALGSVSVLHTPSGANFQVSSGYTSAGGSYVYGKIGWRTDSPWFGQTFLSVDAYQGRNFATSGAISTSYGLSAVQNLEALNGEIYMNLRRYTYSDKTPVNYLPATAVLAGLRWRF